MKLFLQTSSGKPSLALWENTVIYEENYGQMQRLDYGVELTKALTYAKKNLSDIKDIIVDIGPGRLGSTRSAVAFANGLGFALGLQIEPINAFILIGRYAESLHGLPCLILRSAARKQYHWALVQNGQISEVGFAKEALIQLQYEGDIVIAGDATPERARLAGQQNATWLDMNTVPATALGNLTQPLARRRGPVVPLVDTSGLLNNG